MKTILMPTDGSAAADKALELAIDLAEKHGAVIKLLHVLLRDKEPGEILRLPELAAADESIVSELHALEEGPKTERSAEELMSVPNAPERPVPETLLRTIGAHVLANSSALANKSGVSVESLPLADGSAAQAIADAAKAEAADTIVMGTRGLRQIEAMTFGSVYQKVCNLLECTCIAVH